MNEEREVFYTSIEKYPLENHLVEKLNYPDFTGDDGSGLFSLITSAPWGEMQNICRNFSIMKLRGDLVTDNITGNYDLIYFDAFGPDKQPEMWSAAVFEKISAVATEGAILVTYSSKGQVKRNLKACGFEVSLLPGPPGKRHIVRAIKI